MKTLRQHGMIVCGLFALVSSTFSQIWMQTSALEEYWNCIASSADGSKLVPIAQGGNGVWTYLGYVSPGSSGTFENCPAFQCREQSAQLQVPQGRQKFLVVPAGLRISLAYPALKGRAIIGLSLRDMTMLGCGTLKERFTLIFGFCVGDFILSP